MNPLVWVAGAVAGFGVWLVVRTITGRTVALEDAVRAVHTPRAKGGRNFDGRAAELLTAVGVRVDRRVVDLRLLGRSQDRHAATRLAGALLGVTIPTLAAVAVGTGPMYGVVGAVVGGAAGFWWPELRLTETATTRRREARHDVAAYCDLVRSLVAGGADARGALVTAAGCGDGPIFTEIRGALDRSLARSEPAYVHLHALGTAIGVTELVDIAATMQLVTSDGVDPSQALGAKAETLRTAELAQTRADMAAATERMVLPITLIAFAYCAYLTYPALDALIHHH